MNGERKQNAVARTKPGPFDDLKEFIGHCARAKKAMSPETLRENVGKFVNELDQDSKDFLGDLAGILRRPR